MIRVKLSVAMLVLILGFVTVFGIWMNKAFSELQQAVHEADPAVIRERWDGLSGILELMVVRADLDEAEENIRELSSCQNEGEQRQIRDRLERSLERIHNGFVPSFEGVF